MSSCHALGMCGRGDVSCWELQLWGLHFQFAAFHQWQHVCPAVTKMNSWMFFSSHDSLIRVCVPVSAYLQKYGIEHKQNLLLTNFSLLLWHMKKSRSWISRTVTHFYLFEYLVVVPKFWLCRVPHFINFDYMYVNLLCHSNSFYIHPFSRYIWRTLISLHIIRQIM